MTPPPPFPFPLSNLSLRFDEQAATIPWFLRAVVVPLLNPLSSQQFLAPREPEVAPRKVGVRLGRHPFHQPFLLPSKIIFFTAHFRTAKVQNGVCHTEGSEQVSVHTELSSRALIIGYEGRQVVGRGGFKKTRSRQQREPSPPEPPHPTRSHSPSLCRQRS